MNDWGFGFVSGVFTALAIVAHGIGSQYFYQLAATAVALILLAEYRHMRKIGWL